MKSERKTQSIHLAPAIAVGLAVTLLLVAGSAHALQSVTPAAHAPQSVTPADGCGQTLPKANDDGSREYVLTGDLTCSGAVSGVIITASNVVFHLAGHTISNTTCDPNVSFGGIFVKGGTSGVRIDGGTISGFNDGIILSSSASRVSAMTVRDACLFGIVVSGQNNQLDKNVVTTSGGDGIALGSASGTVVTSNDISGNLRAGVGISNFSNNNIVDNNIIHNNGVNGGAGVAIFNGANNVIQNNALNNNFVGISFQSPSNLAEGNSVAGSNNTGIAVGFFGSPSTVRSNTVLGNRTTDMSDGSGGCGANMWKDNTFKTDLVVGVSDGGPGAGCIR